MAKWPDMTGDVLMVYHKIADGRLRNMAKHGGMYDKSSCTAFEKLYSIVFEATEIDKYE